MEDIISKLDSVLKRKNPGLYDRLNIPLTKEHADQLIMNLKFPLPENVRALYEWKNGTSISDEVALGNFWLMPFNAFMDFESSVNFNLQSSKGPLSDYANIDNLFPLFESGGGERTFIDINPTSSSYGQLFFYTLSDPDVEMMNVYADSLFTFLTAIIKCYEEDVYHNDQSGFLNNLEKRESQIFFENNPNSDYWRFYNEVYSG